MAIRKALCVSHHAWWRARNCHLAEIKTQLPWVSPVRMTIEHFTRALDLAADAVL